MLRRKTIEAKKATAERRGLARALAKDRRFRKEVAAAVRHAALARERGRRRIGALPAAARLAGDEQLRRELLEFRQSVRSAWARVEAKRRRRRRRLTLGLLGGAVTAAAVAARSNLGGGADGTARVIQDSVEVSVPVAMAYNQWTQFEEFPRFMAGVEKVHQLDDTRLHWVATVGGKRAEWDAKITEQHPDRQITWVSEEGTLTRGTVSFDERGPTRALIELSISYRPEGLRERVGSALGIDKRRVRGDLERFKELIEARGTETGAWRGQISEGMER